MYIPPNEEIPQGGIWGFDRDLFYEWMVVVVVVDPWRDTRWTCRRPSSPLLPLSFFVSSSKRLLIAS